MKLSEYLKKYGISQAKFSRLIGISPPHLNNIIKGNRNVSIPLGKIIEKTTNQEVSLNDLYNEEAPSKFKNLKILKEE